MFLQSKPIGSFVSFSYFFFLSIIIFLLVLLVLVLLVLVLLLRERHKLRQKQTRRNGRFSGSGVFPAPSVRLFHVEGFSWKKEIMHRQLLSRF